LYNPASADHEQNDDDHAHANDEPDPGFALSLIVSPEYEIT
jgi:hypothetical protein